MAQPSARPEYSNLTLRILSAAVLLPLAVAVVWLGSWYFVAFIVLIGAGMAWEYTKLCGGDAFIATIMVILLGALPVVLVLAGPVTGLGWVVCGVVLILLVTIFRRPASSSWLLGGAAYLAIGTFAIAWLRLIPGDGALTVFWIVAVVVGTDVGAYFAGRGIGGPKLAPGISPSKTWAGLVGGMICAGIAGWAVAITGTGTGSLNVALAGGGFAIIAQIGDLIESAVKRHFGVKDSGKLIPGHGGVLDRLDGYLTVAPAVALVTVIAGESPLGWH